MPICEDDIGTGILGTGGTTELQLGSNATTAGSNVVTPDKAASIIEIIPYQAGNAVVTVSESIITQFRLQSDDVAVEPKKFCLPVVMGFLTTAGQHMIPELQAIPLNVKIFGGERINYFAKPLVANTTATIVGATVVYDVVDGKDAATQVMYEQPLPIGPEQFYTTAAITLATAPAAGTRTTGGVITLTGGRRINFIQPHYGSVVQTAAQAYIGFQEIASADFQTSAPFRFAVQPTGGGLGAMVFSASQGMYKYIMPANKDIPIPKSTATINTFFTNRVIQTGNINFTTTLGYIK